MNTQKKNTRNERKKRPGKQPQHRHAKAKSPWDNAKRPRRSQSEAAETWTGTVSAHPDGFGFADVAGRDKGFFLPREEMKTLLHGDVVEVRAVHRRGRESAELVRIVQEAPSILTGQFILQGGIGLVQPRSRKMPQSILVRARDAGDAHDGDWVRMQIQRGTSPVRGKVLEVLGDVLNPERLIDLIVAEQQLPVEFPSAVLTESDHFSDHVSEKDMRGRMDLRHLPFVTIDGADARDFDDAICVLPRGEGFEAWVSIADVAHYVRPDSALDKEALARGNSFYFPDRVIPMLPEKLSNGLCSLNPDVPRLAMAVRMRFDVNGRRRAVQAYQAVIHSQARLTYAQAAKWLDQRDEKAVTNTTVRDMLDHAARLYRKLEHHRKRRGALDLDVPEVRAVLHEGRVTAMGSDERNIAHHLIEEMMLAANTAVAEYLEQHHCALLYRIHPAPERQAIDALNEFLEPFGIFVRLPKSKDKNNKVRPGDVQFVLEKSEGKPYAHVLHRLVLRSMQQAKYTPENEGHFGLAYPIYCHFTSPIRRYADLTVHRRLKAILDKQNPDKVQPTAKLAAIGAHTSVQERKQQRAEWDTQAMLAALYHRKDVGKQMSAMISGVSKRRIFVELESTLAEGSLSADDLGDLLLDEANHRLHARKGGANYGLGDKLEILIESTDPVRGMINVSLV